MDVGAQQSLKRSFMIALFTLSLVAVIVWIVPSLFKSMLEPPPPTVVAVKKEVSFEDTDRFIADALRRIGAIEVLSREEQDGVVRGIYQLPKGAQTEMVGQRLRGFADEAKIELYASPVDGLDLEIRAYAGAALRHQVLLVPDLPEPPRFRKCARSIDRPMIAIVITNLGESSADKILSLPVPITVAIRPYTPFALRTARVAAEGWHEVLADVPKTMTPQEAQRAVPLASGIWFDGTPVAALGIHDVVVVPADRISGARTPDSLRVLSVQRSDRRDAMQTLRRAQHIASRMGRSALVVDAEDPGLNGVLTWATKAHKDGYRIVLASEAARWEEVQGPSVSLDKR
jgi:hypothetical protein